MPLPILTTKLFIPQPRPDLVPRKRLIEQLNTGLSRKLTVISAPAGFGKSTLLSSWVAQINTNIAWLSLDESDNDPIRFLSYFIAALQTIDGGIGEGILATLQSPGPLNSDLILTTLLNEIAEYPNEIVLVLDDYHVIESKPINQALIFLLNYLPVNLHLVIATRVDPALPMARLRARKQMKELRTIDLRFTRKEATTFLNHIMDLELSEDDIDSLETRTEGWIVGLQLAAISLREKDDRTSFIRSFTGSHHHILDYLIEEVLSQQSPETETFLLKTSILNRLTGPLCDAVCFDETNQRKGQIILERLSKSNLFILPLDDERRWFRYHHLFADLLRHRLVLTNPEEIDGLHKRASIWLEESGYIKQAINHALQMKHKDRAADLIECYAKIFLYQGAAQIDDMLGWFDLLPESLVKARPLLYIYQARALAFHKPFKFKDTIKDILIQVQLLIENDDWGKTTEDTAAGHISSLQGLFSSPPLQPDHDPDKALALFEDALRLLPPNEGRLRSDIYIGIAYEYMHLEDTEAAFKACQIAKTEAQKADNNVSDIIARRNQAVIAYYQGELMQAIEICQQGLTAFSQDGTEKAPLIPGVEALFNALGYMFVEYGDLERAEIELTRGFDLLSLLNEYEAVLMGYIALVRMLIMKGETEQARQICEKLNSERPRFAKLAETLRVQAEISGLETKSASLDFITGWVNDNQHFIEAFADFQGITPWAEMQHLSHMTWIRAQIFLSGVNSAYLDKGVLLHCLDCLERRLQAADQNKLVFRVIEISAVKALLLDSLGRDRNQVLAALEQALLLGEPRGFFRVFIELGKPLERLLLECTDRGITPSYVSKLSTAFEIKNQLSLTTPLTQVIARGPVERKPAVIATHVEPLTDRELEVLCLMAEGLTYNEIAGKIMVSLNTVRTHIKNIYSKLFVHKRSQAIAKARELNIL